MALTKVGKEGISNISNSSDATAITINSSENILIGKTSADNTTVGVRIQPDGFASFARDGNFPLLLNRKSDNGTILDLRKDGTTVGTIGVTSGDQVFFTRATGSQGIKLKNSALMASNADGSDSDNDQDLGSSSVRWKDLYLSGGAFIGGTGSANKLDDYEEGTWTPTADGGSTTYSTQSGLYTKIGNIVYAKFNLEINNFAGSVRYLMGGLPFNSFSSGGGSGSILYFANIHTSAVALFTRTDSNGSTVFISGTTGSSGTIANINHNWANNSANIIGHIIYQTA
jgi:hypothetical protein|tara:strand:+ start:13 stop:867 length:855 start_codon:yes stop_codon:yes gene_type:complete